MQPEPQIKDVLIAIGAGFVGGVAAWVCILWFIGRVLA